MTPAWYMKFTPFARRMRSSDGWTPSTMVGVLSTSAAVKYHWFDPGSGVCPPERMGEGWPIRGCDRGGELRASCCGGVGTAGGTSRRRVGDLDGAASFRGPPATTGGWYPSRGGRYRSMLAMIGREGVSKRPEAAGWPRSRHEQLE